jgi:L-alanine-DL-glutamate epimerase-like enolase superfamily enzyme
MQSASMPDCLITAVETLTVRSPLPVVINFGPWVMKHREFALCRVEADDGNVGTAFVYTRDGPLASFVRQAIAHQYVGQPYVDPEALHWRTAWSNNAILASGLGLRALSLVDLATWDLAARAAGQSIAAHLGGALHALPATAIIGYPPQMLPDEIAAQVASLHAAGWRRFKQPIAGDLETTRARLRAAREAMGPDSWLGLDCNWVFKSANEAIDFARSIRDVSLGWIEDVVPPGNAQLVASIRAEAGVPVAMGDEQGGSYHPEALLAYQAVDVVRLDVTTNGGISRLRRILSDIEPSGVAFAPHMFAHVHSRVFAALGYSDVPVEWGVPGSGVDQYADSLPQPIVHEGLMAPLADEPGLGPQVNPGWVKEQLVDDPDNLLEKL